MAWVRCHLHYTVLTGLLIASFSVGLSQVGCRRDSETKPTAALLADAAKPPPLDNTSLPVPEVYGSDALWARAIEQVGQAGKGNKSELPEGPDEMDLGTLADREGASGLLEALETGGKVGMTALAALPYASDAPIALLRLSQLALQTKGSTQQKVLETIYRLTAMAEPMDEAIDDGASAVCVKALTAIANDAKALPKCKALAMSALRTPFLERVSRQVPVPSASGLIAPAPKSSKPGK